MESIEAIIDSVYTPRHCINKTTVKLFSHNTKAIEGALSIKGGTRE